MRLSLSVPVGSVSLGSPTRPPSPRRLVRVGGVVSMLALLLVAVEGWAPRVLPREDVATSAPDAGVVQAEPSGLDVDGIVEEAGHTPLAVPDRPGTLEVTDSAYRATFDGRGLSYTPAGASASFGISLAAIDRGGSALSSEPGPWAADGNVAVRPVASGITEQVTARSGEVEWDVVLASAPAGRGDLRVVADLGGTVTAPFRVGADGGPAWRFTLLGGDQVLVDEVVVKDASGGVLHRALPEVKDGRLSLVVPGSVLEGAAYPVTVDPSVSSAFPVSNPGFNPAVAFDGSRYLVVFERQFGGDSDIFGAFVTPGGAVEVGPFPISTFEAGDFHADVAWNGESYLVVWENRKTGTAPLDDYDLKGQRLSRTGGFLGEPLHIYGSSYSDRRWDSRFPQVATNNVNFFVTWEDNANFSALGWDVYGKTVTSQGVVGFATRYAGDAKDETFPDVAWNGRFYLIVYNFQSSASNSDVYGQRVDPRRGLVLPDGTTLNGDSAGNRIPISTPVQNQAGVSVASEGQNNFPCDDCADDGLPFLVAWADDRSGAQDVLGARIMGSGAVLDGFGSEIPIATDARGQGTSTKSVAWNGVYFVAYLDISGVDPFPRGIYGKRVNTNTNPATVIDSTPITIADSANVEQQMAASTGDLDRWAVAYEIYDPSGNVRLQTVSPGP